MATQVSTREVLFALHLLQYLHADSTNVYLLLAIVAWERATPNHVLTDTAARSIALRLTSGGAGSGYALAVAAARYGAGTTVEKQTQAIDFITALSLSKWDILTYGYVSLGEGQFGPRVTTTNQARLMAIWSSLLGQTITIPGDPVPPPPGPPPPPAPPIYQHAQRVPEDNYLQPYAALRFYERRHPVIPELTGGLLPTTEMT